MRLLSILLALPLCGQTLTSIVDTLYELDGSPFRGTIKVTAGARECSLTIGNQSYALSERTYCIGVSGGVCNSTSPAGVVNIALVPTVGAQPVGCFYSVRIESESGPVSNQSWQVLASGPMLIKDAKLPFNPSPSARIGVGQIDSFAICDPLTEKNHWTGTAWACVPDQGEGGGSSYTFTAPLSLSGSVVSLPAASGSQNGYLSSVLFPKLIVSDGSYANPAWITSLAWAKITGAPVSLLAANNLSDLVSPSTARASLGLGTAATQPSTAFEASIAAGTTGQYWRWDKTWQTLTTTAVVEGSNLYFTNGRAQTAMAGLYVPPARTITGGTGLTGGGDLTANRTVSLSINGGVAQACGGTDKVSGLSPLGLITCTADQTSGGGSGITSLGGLTAGAQTFSTGTAGSDFGIASVGSVHTFNLPTAAASVRGLLSGADWSTFNTKESSLTFNAPLSRASNTISLSLAAGDIPNLPTSKITSGTFADARISPSSVSQHQAILSVGWAQLTGIPSTFAPSAHNHAASEVTSGTFLDARIAGSNVTQHQALLSIGWSQLTGLPSTFAPSAHNHAAGDISSGQVALARGGTGANLSATGPGFLKQASGGAAVTVTMLVAGDIPNLDAAKINTGTLDRNTTGNAATATALAANGTNCPTGQYARGVDAAGNAEGCTVAGGGGGDGTISFESDGSAVATAGTLNLKAGTGGTVTAVDDGTKATYTIAPDFAVALSKATAQSGGPLACPSSGGTSTAFLCGMNPALTTYTTGMVINWRPNVNNGVNPTLEVDSLGAKAIRLADGSSAPGAGDLVANRLYPLWYDGTVFRLVQAPGGGGGGTSYTFSAPLSEAAGTVSLSLAAGDIPNLPASKITSGTLDRNTTGNAATSTALAANGTNCAEGQYARGVDASGNAEGCTVAGGGGSGSVSFENGGSAVGTRDTLNIAPGTGISLSATDTGSKVTYTPSVDTAVIQSKANLQSGEPLNCASASASSTAYTCLMSPTLTAYGDKMIIFWRPDVSNGATPTLNVDTLGAKSIRLADGTTVPSGGDLVAGRLYPLWYDGTVFRVILPLGGGGGSYTFNAPLSESAGAVSLSLAAGDIPNLPASKIDSGVFDLARLSGITDAQIAAGNKDGSAGTASMRTLGTGAQQSAAGNDSRLSDTRTPTDNTVSTAKLQNSAVTLSKIANVATARLLGNNTGGAAAPVELTTAQVKTMLAIASSDVSGLAASATTDTTSATNISGGTLNAARLPAAAVQTGQANTFGAYMQDLSAAKVKLASGSSLPGTCSAGEVFVRTSGTSGQRVFVCESTNTWVLQGDGGGGGGGSITFVCAITFGSISSYAAPLTDDEDAPDQCRNEYGTTVTIAAVKCKSSAGSPTVTPIITGGGSTSILSSALSCGTSWQTGTLNGTPTLASLDSIDANITAAGGTAKYIVLEIIMTRSL